jgi:hypothetical protein
MSHYKITVLEVLSTTYEVWADSEKDAANIAEMSADVNHPKRHEYEQDIHPPKIVRIDLVDRVCEC